jgi:periplasmic protein TonB
LRDPTPVPKRDDLPAASSPLTLPEREAEAPTSALAGRRLGRGAFAASLALHTGVLLALVLLALWGVPPPEPPVIHVTLSDGPGAAGAAGGSNGGGPAEASAAPAPAASNSPAPAPQPAPPAPEAAAEPQPAPPPQENAPAPPPQPAPEPTPPPPEQVATASPPPPPPPPLPRPPRRKPTPPRPVAAAPPPAPASAPAPSQAPQQLAAAPAQTPGTPGQGGGPGGTAGVGTGAEGAGHGAIGDGPVEGPGDDYLDRLRRWLERYKQYPEAAKQAKQEGELVVSFTILRDGTVRDARIEHSSGFPLLDQAALDMLRNASPVPPLPPTFRGNSAAIDLPVDFSIGFFDRVFN